MGWSLGWDEQWGRFIGYGVVAWCDHPGCDAVIDRGLAYVCANQQPYGGEDGCGLHFCGKHRDYFGRCASCATWFDDDNLALEEGELPFVPKPEHPQWLRHVLSDPSWSAWRFSHVTLVRKYKEQLGESDV